MVFPLAGMWYLGYSLGKSLEKPDNRSSGEAMFSSRIPAALLVTAALVAPPAFATNVHRSPTSGLTTAHKLSKSKHKVVRHARGQQAIDPERVTQIQQALVREHYMTGEANGQWDASTVAAMQKYQADNGWQTKLMPDSRALLKLGLGPDYSTAINAKGSTFEPAQPKSTAPTTMTAGFVAGSGVNQ
jgi:hypothetical protein